MNNIIPFYGICRKLLAKPHLPKNKISHVFCAYNISEEIADNLEMMNIHPVKLSGIDVFDTPIKNHPDMFCFHTGGSNWIFYKEAYSKNKCAIDGLNLNIVSVDTPESSAYPYNIGLNAALLGKYILCNEKYIDKSVYNYCHDAGIEIINIKQGYAKCSVCIINETSVITSDMSVYKACTQYSTGINVLLIESGHIDLHGYDYGFIGGCAGLISANTLAFTGDIEKHPNCGDIKKFCDNLNVEVISLSRKKLYDYGGLLPISEYL